MIKTMLARIVRFPLFSTARNGGSSQPSTNGYRPIACPRRYLLNRGRTSGSEVKKPVRSNRPRIRNSTTNTTATTDEISIFSENTFCSFSC